MVSIVARCIVFLSLFLPSLTFGASPSGFYAGAGYGFTRHPSKSVQVDLNTNAEIESNTHGVVIYAGYRFWDGALVLELDYKDHGEVKGEIVDSGSTIEPDYWISFKSVNFSLIGFLTYPGYEQLKASLRFGLGLVNIDDGPIQYQNNYDSVTISGGLGIEYHFNNQFFVRLDHIAHSVESSYKYDPRDIPGYLGSETELSVSSTHTFVTTSITVAYSF